MEVDGTPASRPGKKYGIHFAAVTIMPGIANVLPYYIWLTELDTEHAVQIPSPTRTAMVITNPTIKGLELHLTAGTTITGYDGKPVNRDQHYADVALEFGIPAGDELVEMRDGVSKRHGGGGETGPLKRMPRPPGRWSAARASRASGTMRLLGARSPKEMWSSVRPAAVGAAGWMR